MMTGGLIIKMRETITDEKMLDILKQPVRKIPEPETFDNVMGPEFHGVAMAEKENILFIFGRDITHSCSFEPYEPSKLDEQLESLPGAEGIVCFLINTVSDTYALSRFHRGQRVAGKSAVEGRTISDFSFDKDMIIGVPMNMDGILQYIKDFSGHYLLDLTDDRETYVRAYFD